MSLNYLLHRPGARIDEIADYLESLSHEHVLYEVRGLGGGDQARLYDLAARAEPLTLEHFVPASRGALKPVIHTGRNTLPVFRDFEKRFARPEGGGDRLLGYNEGFTRALLGPGYFVAHGTAGNPRWETRGAVVVDYFLGPGPDERVPLGWPRVLTNSEGLQKLVYYHTRDFMRRVSSSVSIGAAFKEEKALGAYFVLCREPLP